MNSRFVLPAAAFLALASAISSGCASTEPPPELVNARVAYGRIQSGPTAQYNRAGVMEARQALDSAELQYRDHPSSDEVKTLGYVAQRKAEVAEADARAVAQKAKQQQAETTILQMQTAQAQNTAAQTQQQASVSERRAKIALGRLGIAAKDQPQGTVVTLPGANMFASGSATVLPTATGRLTEIAKAVKQVMSEGSPADVGRKIMINGYTDNTGKAEKNMDLSKKRADAVKTYLTRQGLDATMIEIDGKGDADPIASNDSTAGRAENRRVEIVITPPNGPVTPEAAPPEQK